MALAIAWLSIRWLFGALDLRGHHEPGALELVAASVGFFCLSAGTTLLLLGEHLLDQVEVSRRWAQRRA